jgi:hypothetical protein
MTSEKHPIVTPVRRGVPLRISIEHVFRYRSWDLWDVQQALTIGRLPHYVGSVEELRNHVLSSGHCAFLDQLAPTDPLDARLIHAAVLHVLNVADQLNPWDDCISLQETWPKVRDETIDTFIVSELQVWDQQFGPATPQPNTSAHFRPTMVREALKSHADNYFDQVLRHVINTMENW